jgi:hypothetical protein
VTTLPLSGVRVLDLTRVLSGPFCTMLLGDLGADVIKVEAPGDGDTVRHQGAIKDGLSWYFANYNRNKRSITLNLRTDQGRDILARLIAKRRRATCWWTTIGPACWRRWASPMIGSTRSIRAWFAAASRGSAKPARIATGRASISSPRR